jgi:hypothetical protein
MEPSKQPTDAEIKFSKKRLALRREYQRDAASTNGCSDSG